MHMLDRWVPYCHTTHMSLPGNVQQEIEAAFDSIPIVFRPSAKPRLVGAAAIHVFQNHSLSHTWAAARP